MARTLRVYGGNRYLMLPNSYGEQVARVLVPVNVSDREALEIRARFVAGTPNRRARIVTALREASK